MNARRLLLTALLLAACGGYLPSDDYSTKLHPLGEDAFELQLTSVKTMSADAVKRGLLSEAARATIERGRVWLRIDSLSTDSAMDVREKSGEGSAEPGYPSSPDPSYRSEVSLSKQRTGAVRFTILREKEEGARVFDASQLLDRVRRGELPVQ